MARTEQGNVGEAFLSAIQSPLTNSYCLCILYASLFVLLGRDFSYPVELVFEEHFNVTPTAISANSDDPHCTNGRKYFVLFILFAASMASVPLMKFLRLPPLIGMLIIGCLLRNLPFNLFDHVDSHTSYTLRSMALCIVLLNAGLGLDPKALKRLSFLVIRLAFAPCLVEALTVAIASHFILQLPWIYAILLGFVLAAVSPAVVVPTMFMLEKEGYGVDKGVSTLIIAAASVDDVLAITGFGVSLAVAFGSGNVFQVAIGGPLQALLGILLGSVAGLILWFLPGVQAKRLHAYRFHLILCSGITLLFGSDRMNLSGTGPLAVLVVAFVSGLGWRRNAEQKEKWSDGINPVVFALSELWWIVQPFLFGLIGSEVDFKQIDISVIGRGLLCVIIALAMRMISTFLVVGWSELNFRERLFTVIAWLPKATVQAIFGPVVLDRALQPGSSTEVVLYGKQIVTVAVLAIILTAPLGAYLMSLSAPYLLHRTNTEIEQCISEDDVMLRDRHVGPRASR